MDHHDPTSIQELEKEGLSLSPPPPPPVVPILALDEDETNQMSPVPEEKAEDGDGAESQRVDDEGHSAKDLMNVDQDEGTKTSEEEAKTLEVAKDEETKISDETGEPKDLDEDEGTENSEDAEQNSNSEEIEEIKDSDEEAEETKNSSEVDEVKDSDDEAEETKNSDDEAEETKNSDEVEEIKDSDDEVEETKNSEEVEQIKDSQATEESKNSENIEEIKKSEGKASDEDEDEDMPMIRMNSSIFEAQNDEEEEDEDDHGMDPEAVQSMMEVEMGESSSGSSPKRKPKIAEETPARRTPRRQAAVVASNTIRKMSNLEKDVQENSHRKSNDVEYIDTVASTPTTSRLSSSEKHISSDKQRCHQCKQTAPSLIVVRQYGTDIHLCSNNCFNMFRNPDPSFRPLPCAKCGVLSRDTEKNKLYFWETMNFCSDLCVGNFQMQIGSTCSTCCKKTPWNCMGKYCVRFGSDIRQFCTPACLETYKRNARVCFHCQLDIKKLGNVVLANIPNKPSPKEFCSQDCVEQYIDQNINTMRIRPPPMIHCHTCKAHKPLYKELVTAIMSYKVCSFFCWDKLLVLQMIQTATKCETCAKFINMDTVSISPSFYLATDKKAHGFCSATCKNVFVLKTRQIQPCSSCQVKKYNYDLIQHYAGGIQAQNNFAVCSLNCLPKPSHYIASLKLKITDSTLMPPPLTTIVTTTSTPPTYSVSTLPAPTRVSESIPYEICLSNEGLNYNGNGDGGDGYEQDIQIEGVSSLADGSGFMNGEYEANNYNEYFIPVGEAGEHLTVREVSQDEFDRLRNTAGYVSVGYGSSNEIELQTEEQQEGEVVGEEVGAGEEEVWDEEVADEGVPYEDDAEESEYIPFHDDMWADFERIMSLTQMAAEPVEVRNKGCQVRSTRNTRGTQTDPGVMGDMPRIQPRVKVLILPVPVFIPFPVFNCQQPVPTPYPVGIPVPIPVPILLEQVKPAESDLREPAEGNKSEPAEGILREPAEGKISEPAEGNIREPAEPNEISSPASPLIPRDVPEILPPKEDISDEPHGEDTIGGGTDEVEMMDTSDAPEVPPSEDLVPEPTSESNSSTFGFGSSNSPMSVGSPSLFKGSLTPGPGSPSVGGRGRGSRSEYGLRAWKLFFGDEDPASLTPETLSEKLVEWTSRGTKPKGDRYQPDAFFYFFLGIQQHLRTNGRPDQIFYETLYAPFVVSFTAYAEQEMSRGCCIAKVEEDHVWDANELGPITPGVLLFTLVYYIYKNFGLKTWEEHAALQFDQVKINERDSSTGEPERYVTITGISNLDSGLVEAAAEPENPFRCIVKLLEFYTTKCDSTEGSFYKSINLMALPTDHWYCKEPLDQMDLYRMLVRAQMICFTAID